MPASSPRTTSTSTPSRDVPVSRELLPPFQQAPPLPRPVRLSRPEATFARRAPHTTAKQRAFCARLLREQRRPAFPPGTCPLRPTCCLHLSKLHYSHHDQCASLTRGHTRKMSTTHHCQAACVMCPAFTSASSATHTTTSAPLAQRPHSHDEHHASLPSSVRSVPVFSSIHLGRHSLQGYVPASQELLPPPQQAPPLIATSAPLSPRGHTRLTSNTHHY